MKRRQKRNKMKWKEREKCERVYSLMHGWHARNVAVQHSFETFMLQKKKNWNIDPLEYTHRYQNKLNRGFQTWESCNLKAAYFLNSIIVVVVVVVGLLLPCPFHWNQSCIYMYKCIVSYISLCSPLGVLYKILHLPLALPQKYQNSWALWHWRCVSISRLRYVSDDSTNISQVFIYKHKFIYLNGSYEEGGRGMTSFLAKTWIISFGWRIVGERWEHRKKCWLWGRGMYKKPNCFNLPNFNNPETLRLNMFTILVFLFLKEESILNLSYCDLLFCKVKNVLLEFLQCIYNNILFNVWGKSEHLTPMATHFGSV